jgi:proteic killer suppression protein
LFVEKGDASKLPVRNIDRVRRILAILNDARTPQDMNLSGMFFHRLHGDNRWSVRVTGNWPLTFDWRGLDAIDIDIEDYH